MLPEQIAVTMLVADALEALGAPYAIGGSFASALHGVMRATMDADLVADLRLEQVAPLAQALGKAFYADAEMMREAIRRHSSFNLIHLETLFKVGERLDLAYMRRMATGLSVADLLARALEETA